jgi:hypothetical protein
MRGNCRDRVAVTPGLARRVTEVAIDTATGASDQRSRRFVLSD